VLIDLVEAFDDIESRFGLAGPLPRSGAVDRVGAVRDQFAVWFFRDVRWVVDEGYLHDVRVPLPLDRRRERERVLGALRDDLSDRGGL
jgi:hypothetical protein